MNADLSINPSKEIKDRSQQIYLNPHSQLIQGYKNQLHIYQTILNYLNHHENGPNQSLVGIGTLRLPSQLSPEEIVVYCTPVDYGPPPVSPSESIQTRFQTATFLQKHIFTLADASSTSPFELSKLHIQLLSKATPNSITNELAHAFHSQFLVVENGSSSSNQG